MNEIRSKIQLLFQSFSFDSVFVPFGTVNKMNWLLACVFFAIIFCELNCAGIPESDSNPKLDSNPKSHSGNGIQIATADSTSFTLNDENLKKLRIMLEAEDIKDLEIVVVSIAGTFKWGKSFLMNFFIRYLEANEV